MQLAQVTGGIGSEEIGTGKRRGRVSVLQLVRAGSMYKRLSEKKAKRRREKGEKYVQKVMCEQSA